MSGLNVITRQPKRIKFVGPDELGGDGKTLLEGLATITESRRHRHASTLRQIVNEPLSATWCFGFEQLEVEIKRTIAQVPGMMERDQFLLITEFLHIHGN